MTDTMSDARGQFAAKAAESLLRSLGAANVTLRYPMLAEGGDARQLGLAAAQSEDAVVGPAVMRTLETKDGERVTEVLLTAETILSEMERRGEASAERLLSSVYGVLRDGKLLRFVSFAAENFLGVDYLYRLRVAE